MVIRYAFRNKIQTLREWSEMQRVYHLFLRILSCGLTPMLVEISLPVVCQREVSMTPLPSDPSSMASDGRLQVTEWVYKR